jgi:hypothetical protein
MGTYTTILLHTPDQGGKTSLTNTRNDDILEYILAKLVTRIVVKSRTFLVKVKTNRGQSLNEGAEDLPETEGNGKTEHGPKPFTTQEVEG